MYYFLLKKYRFFEKLLNNFEQIESVYEKLSKLNEKFGGEQLNVKKFLKTFAKLKKYLFGKVNL